MVTRTKTLRGFWLDAAQLEGLKAIKARDGVNESEQVRRAIDAWLEQKGARSRRARGAGPVSRKR